MNAHSPARTAPPDGPADASGHPQGTETGQTGPAGGLPKVSIIVPSYNQGRFLGHCLESLFSQKTGPEAYGGAIEVLLADGGSSDTSIEVIDQYASRMAWHVSEHDKGTWDAANKALSKATGEVVMVVNSDDYLLDGALSRLGQAYLEAQRPAWLTSKVRAVNEWGATKSVFYPRKPPHAPAGLSFLDSCWIYHPGTWVQRRYLDEGFYPTDLLDWDLWLRLERAGHEPVLLMRTTAALRFHGDCKSFDTRRIHAQFVKLLKARRERLTAGLDVAGHEEYDERLKAAHLDLAMQTALVELRSGASRIQALSTLYQAWKQHGVRAYLRRMAGLARRIALGGDVEPANPLSFLDRPWVPIPEDAY